MKRSTWRNLWPGHLGSEALIGVCLGDAPPPHLDRCGVCQERLAEACALLDGARSEATEAADGVFTPNRLAAQRVHILRRIDRVAHPARIVAFPAVRRPEPRSRLVARQWVAMAAAGGLLIGVVAGSLVDFRPARQESRGADPRGAATRVADARGDAARGPALQPASFNEEAFLSDLESAADALGVEELQAIDALTPHVREVHAVLLR